jgi:hypothetical protein
LNSSENAATNHLFDKLWSKNKKTNYVLGIGQNEKPWKLWKNKKIRRRKINI